MTTPRQLHLFAFMRPVCIHAGGWRFPGAYAEANFNFGHLKRFAQRLEAAKFDAFFMADHLAVLNMPMGALKRSHTVTSFEPFTLLSALAAVTERIGLVGSASTTFDAPFHVARRFASLDHLSGGRAGWNVVTTANPDAALNFGLAQHMPHAERYERAREFWNVVTGLWDSFADDAFVRDQASGIYFDPAKLHIPDHKGPHFSVRGPLNIARPVQGWPVPGGLVVVGDSIDEAREKRAHLDSLVHADSALAALSVALGCDVRVFNPDAPLPEIPESNASKGNRAHAIALAQRENLTVRKLAQRYGGYAGLAFVGTPRSIADEMEQWLLERGCDGFNVMFPYLPQGVDDVVDKVVPELQRRGLFRRAYAGLTLRETLGLRRPARRLV